MRSLFRFGFSLAFVSLFFVACGDAPAGPGLEGDPRGGVSVAAKSLQDLEEVASVTVTLSDSEASYELALAADTDGVWRGQQDNLYVGEYAVEALAKDAGGNTLFAAAPDQTVLITKDATTALTLYLNEVAEPGEVEFPRFEMISLDKAVVEQWERLTVTVEVEGGEGPYQIAGENALNPPAWNPPGSFHDPQFSGTTGSIDWEPPAHAGAKWFKVRVTDARGNVAEVGIDVAVGSDVGSAQVEVDFIMAPITEITGRVLNDNEGTTAYLWVTGADAGATGPVAYTWDHGDCGGVFESGAESGTFTPPAPSAGWYFKYQIDRPLLDPPQTTPGGTDAGDPAGIGLCTIGLHTEGDHGATYVNDVVIDTTWVQPATP